MRIIDQLQTYREPYVNSPSGIRLRENPEKSSIRIEQAKVKLNNISSQRQDNIITRPERDFFIKLFPENSEQLEKHILFTRNGKIQTQTFGKGLMVDGKA